jgi:UDP-N-acetylmuramyl pentapeptide phosphotransferase/UDP-N-acetylglucosamine-1-phosphate transferase
MLRGGLLALGLSHALRAVTRWDRTNHRGRPVSLLPGVALAAAAPLAAPSTPEVVAGLTAGALGLYDDVAGERGSQKRAKGLGGHAAALREGRVTSGAVKVAGLGAAGVVAAALQRPRGRGPLAVLAGGAVVAGTANLLNLLDLRPGRALKAAALTGAAVGQPQVVGAALALLPDDLRERAMLGDTGANAVGAVLGVGLLRRVPSTAGRTGVLAVLTALTLASERVSFTAVIERTPVLRELDRWGRLP